MRFDGVASGPGCEGPAWDVLEPEVIETLGFKPLPGRLGKECWLGRQDSNLRMPVPKTGALPLGYAPAVECLEGSR